jgi:hypothetical protein
LHKLKLLPEEFRAGFVSAAFAALAENADSSIFDDSDVEGVFTQQEMTEAKRIAKAEVLGKLPAHIAKLRSDWDRDYPPDDYFYDFERSIKTIAEAVDVSDDQPVKLMEREIRYAINAMEQDYEPSSSTSAPVGSSTPQVSGLGALFRDVDE